jgi:hypothetical protein
MMESESLLKDLLKQNEETVILEFKREIKLGNDKEKNEFAKDVSALANTRGGNIVFGKEDPKQGGLVVGIDRKTYDCEQMQQVISSRCYPPVKFDAELIQLENKWFALLTIPVSSMKPHEIIGSREVWVRRGNTTDKATDRERMFMHKETERVPQTGEMQQPERASDQHRDLAICMAILVLGLMIYLPIRFEQFWASGLGLFRLNFETFGFPLVFLAIVCVGWGFFENAFIDILLRTARRTALPYLFGYAFFTVLVSVINLEIFSYPESSRMFFGTSFVSFLIICVVDFLILSLMVVLLHFPMTRYYSSMENEEYKPNPRIEFGELTKSIRRYAKLARKKLYATAILIPLLLTIGMVPLDLHFNLFTPSYHNEGETFSHSYPFFSPSSDGLYLFISSFRNAPELIQSEYKFYRLAQTEYIIYPAKLPLSNLIRIPNPTNITSGSTQNPSIDPTSSTYYDTNIGSVYTNVSKSVSYIFVPNNYNFTGIDFNVTGIKEPVIANLTYWKLVNPDVSITTAIPVYTNLGNGTWLENYTYLISNNEKIPLTIMDLDFDRFSYQVVNDSTTQVYVNGQIAQFAHFVIDHERLGLWIYLGAGNSLSLTVTLQSSDIS